MKVKKWSESPSVVPNSLWPHGLYCPWHSPGQNTGVGSLSLLQGIFQTQGLNTGLLHCTWILYQLSQKWSPRILVWVTYPSFRGSSQPRNPTRVSCIAGGSFTNWATREAMREKENFWQKNILLSNTHSKLFTWLSSLPSFKSDLLQGFKDLLDSPIQNSPSVNGTEWGLVPESTSICYLFSFW